VERNICNLGEGRFEMKQKSFFCLSKLFIFFLFIFIFIFTIGCPPSLVYSPSANLPPKPLKKGQAQLLGGIGMFPEARPRGVDNKIAIGGEATFRFALSDHFALQAKGWIDFSDNVDFSRYGLSVSSIIMFNDDESSYRIGIMPTGAFLFGSGLEGGGGVLPICLWFPEYRDFNFYISLGPGFGLRSVEDNWGWGILTNLGTSILISDHFTLNLEVSGIFQKNEYENVSDFILSPSFNLGILF
jgi:hypothetical protein